MLSEVEPLSAKGSMLALFRKMVLIRQTEEQLARAR